MFFLHRGILDSSVYTELVKEMLHTIFYRALHKGKLQNLTDISVSLSQAPSTTVWVSCQDSCAWNDKNIRHWPAAEIGGLDLGKPTGWEVYSNFLFHVFWQGYVNQLKKYFSSQGLWCMRHDCFSPTKRGVEPKRAHANSMGDTEMDGSESGIIYIFYQPIDEDKIATFFRCIKQIQTIETCNVATSTRFWVWFRIGMSQFMVFDPISVRNTGMRLECFFNDTPMASWA